MAIALEPAVLIADEPTTALDATVQAQVLDVLSDVQRGLSGSMVLITHDLGVVADLADRVVVMYSGRSVEHGSVYDVYERPRHPYTSGLLGAMPRVDGAAVRLAPITGAPPNLIGLPDGCSFAPRCHLATEICLEEQPELRWSASGSRPVAVACHHA